METPKTPSAFDLKNFMRERNQNEVVFTTVTATGGHEESNIEFVPMPRSQVFEENPLWSAEQLAHNRVIFKQLGTYSKFTMYRDHVKVFYSIMGNIEFKVPMPTGEKKIVRPMGLYCDYAGWVKDLELWLAAQKVEMLDISHPIDLTAEVRNILDTWVSPYTLPAQKGVLS